jgi:hypothetical protein
MSRVVEYMTNLNELIKNSENDDQNLNFVAAYDKGQERDKIINVEPQISDERIKENEKKINDIIKKQETVDRHLYKINRMYNNIKKYSDLSVKDVSASALNKNNNGFVKSDSFTYTNSKNLKVEIKKSF